MAGRSGKMPTTSVRRRISLLRRSWIGLLDQIWRQTALGKAAKARMSSRAASRCSAAGGELGLQGVDDLAVLGVHGGGVGLFEDGAYQRGHPRLCRLRDARGQVPVVVRVMPTSA